MDFIYPSAVSGKESPSFVIHESVAQLSSTSFQSHTKCVFLSSLDRTEIQRCASMKIPCVVSIQSLQQAFDLLKVSGVSFVHVNMNGPPVIDYAWMSGAHDNQIGVVFSLKDLQEAFNGKNVNALQEYRKAARLLFKSHVPLHIVSFARTHEEVLSSHEQRAWLTYLGVRPLGGEEK